MFIRSLSATIQHPLILSVKPQKALSLIIMFISLMRDFLMKLEYSVMKAVEGMQPLYCGSVCRSVAFLC